MEANIGLQASTPEDAEFYVVVQGSRLSHVTTAKRRDDGLTLCFTVPGRSISQLHTTQVSLYSYHCLTNAKDLL